MNTRTDLELVCSISWREKTPAFILADYLCEHENYTRAAALRVAAHFRRKARHAAEMIEAAALMKEGAPTRRRVLRLLLRFAPRDVTSSVTTVLVEGRKPPRVVSRPHDEGASAWWEITVTYSAGWLLREQAARY